MNHKKLLALLLCLVIIISSKFYNTDDKAVIVKNVSSNVDKYMIESLIQNDESSNVNIFYPVTPYQNVNDYIMEKIELYKVEFENSTYTSDLKTLDISFEEYEYNDYISFKFNVRYNIGITHENNEIFTVVYKEEKIIDIYSLESEKNDILDLFYEICMENLKANSKITQYSNESWLQKGLEKNEENYSNFIFTENGMVLIFNPYTIAPYVAGIIEVEIPYSQIEGML